MSFAATMNTLEPRSFGDGPLKKQLFTFTAVSADVSGTITCDRLTTITHIELAGGIRLTAAPTYAGNVATIAFTDPSTAGWFGSGVAYGK